MLLANAELSRCIYSIAVYSMFLANSSNNTSWVLFSLGNIAANLFSFLVASFPGSHLFNLLSFSYIIGW